MACKSVFLSGLEQPVGDIHNKPPNRSTSVQPPDCGWGWVVTFSSFFIGMVVDGVNGISGIFYLDLLSAFGGSKGKTQTIGSVMYGILHHILAPLSGVVMGKYGHRKVAICGGLISSTGLFLSTFSPNLDVMILLYGFVGGFGMALLYPTSLVIVGIYFEKRRALATGIAVSGSGIGALVFAPISEILLETYGWRGTIWLLSAVVLNTVVCGSLYRHIGKQESTAVKSGITKNKCLLDVDFSLLTHPVFLLQICSCFLYLTGYNIPFSYLPAQGKFVELSSQESALLISIIGISGTISRILIGYISDKRCVNTLVLNSTMLMIGGLAFCFVPYCTTFIALSLYSAVYGAVAASFASLMTINLVKLMGLQNLSSTLGIQFLFMGVGSFIGSPIAGVLSETSSSYNNAFYFGGVVMGIAGLIGLPLSCLVNRKQSRGVEINGLTNIGFTLEQTTDISLKLIKQVSNTST